MSYRNLHGDDKLPDEEYGVVLDTSIHFLHFISFAKYVEPHIVQHSCKGMEERNEGNNNALREASIAREYGHFIQHTSWRKY